MREKLLRGTFDNRGALRAGLTNESVKGENIKTYSHDELTVKAGKWLHSKVTMSGIRSEFEVAIAKGYIADYVALTWLQGRFMELYGAIGGGWIKEEIEPGCDILRPAQYPAAPSLVLVFEAKASRSDFLSTFNNSKTHANRKEPVGSFHWVIANHRICEPNELPDFWGLLMPSGRGLHEVRRPTFHDISKAVMNEIAYRILWKSGYGRHDRILYALTQSRKEFLALTNK